MLINLTTSRIEDLKMEDLATEFWFLSCSQQIEKCPVWLLKEVRHTINQKKFCPVFPLIRQIISQSARGSPTLASHISPSGVHLLHSPCMLATTLPSSPFLRHRVQLFHTHCSLELEISAPHQHAGVRMCLLR